MMAATERAHRVKAMLVTTDLKLRLSPKFFAHLVSQLKSSSKRAPPASCSGDSKLTAAILHIGFEANNAWHGRMRLAALQT